MQTKSEREQDQGGRALLWLELSGIIVLTMLRMANLCIQAKKAIYTNSRDMLKLINTVSPVTPGDTANVSVGKIDIKNYFQVPRK